ncbi:hypothetical protein [Pseudocolwellia sp. HL-MZ7]|uniref:hypothetical protein n=1 Tax=Pseudocolwellia sp. HL-MZ7 TaxID=3400627 RepID=UPI003CF4AEDC
MVEYILGVAVLSSILFVPVDGKSLASQLVYAVKKEHAAYISVSSMSNVSAVLCSAIKKSKSSDKNKKSSC